MNPLLHPFETPFETPPFAQIKTEHYFPAVEAALAQAREEIAKIRENPAPPTFANTAEALEAVGESLGRVLAIFFNLNNAETNPEMQALAKQISPLYTQYRNDVLLDEALFARLEALWQQKTALGLAPEEQMLLERKYKAFVRNGARLGAAEKERLREIDKSLATLALQFGDNVLAENNGFQLVIENEEELAGLPAHVCEAAAQSAQQKGQPGKWTFTLDYPSYVPFMTYAQHRPHRETLYRAFNQRGFQDNAHNNTEIIRQIVGLRHERARLLGYPTHAHFVLEERMAQNPEQVMDFLQELLRQARPAAEKEMAELRAFARQTDGLEDVKRWDYAFYAEKLKREKFQVDDQLLRPYFSLDRVVKGVFEVARRLYGLQFIENTHIPKYHPDVQTYAVEDETGKHLAVFYADFFPRPGKKPGAWMTSFRGQSCWPGHEYRPHISIVCNFAQPTPSQPSLLTLQEVLTLFHEFGHALHGLLADTQYESLSGTNVFWDFVELPSQIMENWVYEKETLDLFARHYQTDALIPADLVEKVKASANFMEGYQTLRQIGFALLDMAWHSQVPSKEVDLLAFEREAMAATQLFEEVRDTNFSTAFAHIFQGGYSAGYYSYKWAEVLDADAFAHFQEKGIFDRQTAHSFREHILSKGGSEAPMTLYLRFRGKMPDSSALLKRSGLLEKS
ncbi:MAG: M3 family metallopeptidase [Microscillaceae bacterium]|nr:M3 family metallopeptidase [Microscillaceae bacterium]